MAITVQYLDPAVVAAASKRAGLGEYRRYQQDMLLRQQQLAQQGQQFQQQLMANERMAMFNRASGLERMQVGAQIQQARDQDFQAFQQQQGADQFARQLGLQQDRQLGAMDVLNKQQQFQQEQEAINFQRRVDAAEFDALLKRRDLDPATRKEAIGIQRDILGLREAHRAGTINQEQFDAQMGQLQARQQEVIQQAGPAPTLEDDWNKNVITDGNGRNWTRDQNGVWQRVRGDDDPPEIKAKEEQIKADLKMKESIAKMASDLLKQTVPSADPLGPDKPRYTPEEAVQHATKIWEAINKPQQQQPPAAEQGKPPTDMPQVTTPEEAMQLPPGTQFIDPQGNVRIRP